MMPTTSECLLLDTHVWIWIINDEPKARRARALELVEKAATSQSLRLSWVSIWEVGMLEAHGRIILPVPLREWVLKGLEAPGLRLADLDPDILIESTRLPGGFQCDPMDNILIATARRLDARIVTADRKILDYAKRDFVKVLAFV